MSSGRDCSYTAVEKQRSYHERHTIFIIHLFIHFITDWGRVDASGAERKNDCGAGSFFRIANAAQMENRAFSHSLWSRSRAIISGIASSGRPWPSVTMTQDESTSSKVFKPKAISCSKDKAFLYAALNFREPNERLCQ